MNEYADAISEMLAVFDDDPLMTEEVLASVRDGQQTAQDAALARIRDIGRTALEGRRPLADDAVPGMHEHTWELTAVQERTTLALIGQSPKYTAVLGRCRSCGEPGSWTLAGTWTLDQITGAAR